MSKEMHRYTVYLYLETALHVSCGTSTHHQERIQLCLHHLVFGTPVLLSAAIVEEFISDYIKSRCEGIVRNNKFDERYANFRFSWQIGFVAHVDGKIERYFLEKL
jgi:hypothetical protein